VGKSSLLYRMVENEFLEKPSATVGTDFSTKTIEYQNQSVQLQLWDTSGQEKFNSLTRSYYQGAKIAILVYDITDYESFSEAKELLEDVKSLVESWCVFVLVGNKLDLESNRTVSIEEATNYAKRNDLLFIEISPKDGTNIDELFRMVLPHIILSESEVESSTIKLASENNINTNKTESKIKPKCCS